MPLEDFNRETGEIIQAPAGTLSTAAFRPLASTETDAIMAALCRAQAVIEAPRRTKHATIRPREGAPYSYTYAPLEEVIRVIQHPFADAGLVRQQYLVSRAGAWFVRTVIWHLSGQWISSDYPIFAEKMTAHSFAGGVTYASRRGLCLVLGLAPEDDDDSASQPEAGPATAKPPQSPAEPRQPKRVDPPVTMPNEHTNAAREAWKRLARVIDDCQSAEALQEVYDPVLDCWGEPYEADAATVQAEKAVALIQLKKRVADRLQNLQF